MDSITKLAGNRTAGSCWAKSSFDLVSDWDEFVSCCAAHHERRTSSYPSIFTPWGDEIDILNASSAMECPSRYPESFSKVWRRPEADCGVSSLS